MALTLPISLALLWEEASSALPRSWTMASPPQGQAQVARFCLLLPLGLPEEKLRGEQAVPAESPRGLG